jgi:hypothetical protein
MALPASSLSPASTTLVGSVPPTHIARCLLAPLPTHVATAQRVSYHVHRVKYLRASIIEPSRSAGESFYHVTKILGGGVRKLEREEIEPFVSSKPAETLHPRKRQTSSQLNCYVTYLNIENSSGSN